ncbi:unnamed protein product [Phyllotreta striolata]|uniref:Platelet-derived growth factor (PDGF) family profile domain-containing protein n=1 Tax=Phyllotreta striolata TaxID=444603 RepID=A0A9N9TX31_PHYSR|nr:unnamed protein product [Phyllotreta striolata]
MDLLIVIICSLVFLTGSKQDKPKSDSERIYFPPEFKQRMHGNIHHTYEFHKNHPFPPGFQHDPEFHRTHFGKSLDDKNIPRIDHNHTAKEIPLDIWRKYEETDLDEFLANYVEGFEEERKIPLFANRFGDDGQERNGGAIPAKATCIPESVTVPLTSTDDPTVMYLPKCTRIERCGGCCNHKLMSCQPNNTETVSLQVIKTQYTGGKRLKFLGKQIIPVERHLECKCACRVKAKDCLPHQHYNAVRCACECSNRDEEGKCYRDSDIKYWDHKHCACRCNFVMECTSGSFYDHNECRCKRPPARRNANARIDNKEAEEVAPVGPYDVK